MSRQVAAVNKRSWWRGGDSKDEPRPGHGVKLYLWRFLDSRIYLYIIGKIARVLRAFSLSAETRAINEGVWDSRKVR